MALAERRTPASAWPKADVAPGNPITLEFEGNSVRTFLFRGRLVWIANEIGRALGYRANGRGLVACIRTVWSTALLEGRDFVVIEGPELAEFHRLARRTGAIRGGKLMLFTESGLNIVLERTWKDAGDALYLMLTQEVIPAFKRTSGREQRSSQARVPQDTTSSQSDPRRSSSSNTVNETRGDRDVTPARQRHSVSKVAVDPKLQARINNAKARMAREYRLAFDALCDWMEAHGAPADTIMALRVMSTELSTGVELSDLYPDAAKNAWLTPEQFAKLLEYKAGIELTGTMVGVVAEWAGFNDDEELCEPRAIELRDHHGKVVEYYYNPKMIDRFPEAHESYEIDKQDRSPCRHRTRRKAGQAGWSSAGRGPRLRRYRA